MWHSMDVSGAGTPAGTASAAPVAGSRHRHTAFQVRTLLVRGKGGVSLFLHSPSMSNSACGQVKQLGRGDPQV
ncbi:hypothetical protein FRAHR75_1270012 [Frankia sp. Hr75.2]|nr:hypothetical protein FRAHR75_1270012 [Frankia sp. Hr75.2]